MGGRRCQDDDHHRDRFRSSTSHCPRRRRKPCCCGHRIRHPGPHRSSSKQQARGIDRQRKSIYLGGLVNASADIMPEIKRRVRLAWVCYERFQRELYDMEAALFTLKVRIRKGRGDGRLCCTGVQREPSARSTSPSYERRSYGSLAFSADNAQYERRTIGFSYGPLAFSADNAQTTSCRTPRPSRRHNARASRRPSANGISLRGAYSG